jgi:hypothetical protein
LDYGINAKERVGEVNTIRDKRVKARKEHICDFCEKKIAKGEEYRLSTHIYDGQIYDWHSCDRCRGYVSQAFKYYGDLLDEGLTAEAFYEYMRECCPDVAEEWWG